MKSSANGTYTDQTSGRRNFFVILLGIMTIIGGLFYSATDVSAADTLSLIVKMTSGLTVEEQMAVIARNGGVETSSVPALRLHIVTVSTADLPLVQQNYQADAQVVSIEVNKTRKAEAVPTDANYGVQWALARIGWESVFGTVAPNGTAKLALLDTGVDATHPDLAGVVIPGTSILDGTDGLGDPSGHGTWLAGIAAAAIDNGAGIAGIAFGGVQIMPVSVLNAGGTGQDSDIIAGIVWAVDHGADVILMGFSNPDFSQNLQDAVDYAWLKGVVLVAATGNDGVTTPTFPAGDRGVIGVSATDPNDLLSPASNYGQDTFLAAPGTDIYTTGPNGGYSYINGTSASSAFVAGAAAFMKAVDPLLTNGIIVGRLARAADAIGAVGDPNNTAMFGNGRLNMAKALADTGIDPVQPAGTPGGGGPFVGPYTAAANAKLTVTVSGNGRVSSSPAGIDTCRAGSPTNLCTENYTITAPATNVALTPTPDSGYLFTGWGGNCSGTGTCVVAMNDDKNVTASFTTTTTITPSFSASNKIYDGNTSATVSFTGFTPGVGSDNVSLTYTSETFADKTVANGKTVTISGLSLTGTDAYKYSLSSSTATTTADITALHITGSFTASNKTYDGNTSATVLTRSLNGVLAGDAANVSLTGGTATFSDASVANGKTVTLAGASLTGSAAGNYALDSVGTTTANITQATPTVAVTGGTFTYDGSPHPATATATGVGGAAVSGSFTFTYTPGGSSAPVNAAATAYGISASFISSEPNYTDASGTGSITINKATSTTAVTVAGGTTFTYDGNAHPATVSVTGVGGLNLTPAPVYSCGLEPQDVSDSGCTASYTFAGDANHDGSTDSKAYTISKAPSTTAVTVSNATYDGAAHGGTATVTGAGGLSLSLTVSYSGRNGTTYGPSETAPTNAGDYTASASFAGDANHTASSDSKTYTINKANATCTVTGYSVIYDGNPHTATGSCTGVNGEGLSGLNFSSTTHTNVGGYSDSWSFTNANYNDKNDTVTDTIQAWTLKGFYQPVDMNGVWNTVKNGSTVPLKFEVFSGTIELTDVSKIKSVNSVQVTCANDAMENAIEEVLTTTGGTALRYDSTGGQFVDNWKTPNKAGNCYRVTMTTQDGSSLMALFKLK